MASANRRDFLALKGRDSRGRQTSRAPLGLRICRGAANPGLAPWAIESCPFGANTKKQKRPVPVPQQTAARATLHHPRPGVRGNPHSALLCKLPLTRGEGFSRMGQSQTKAGGQLPLTPDPSPQKGRGEKGCGCAAFQDQPTITTTRRIAPTESASSAFETDADCARRSVDRGRSR